jgi:hypothetical protein
MAGIPAGFSHPLLCGGGDAAGASKRAPQARWRRISPFHLGGELLVEAGAERREVRLVPDKIINDAQARAECEGA